MKNLLLALTGAAIIVVLHPATIRIQGATDLPGDVVACDADGCPAYVSSVIGTYGPTTVSTNHATIAYAAYRIGPFQAGTTVRLGTCGMAGAMFTGDTVLRLFIAGTTTQVAFNDNSCAGTGSQINYVVPYNMRVEVHAGCSGSTVGCGGAIALSARLDATPRPVSVKAAFSRIIDEGVLAVSPDTRTLIRGITYMGALPGAKYHHQGIARTYTRAAYDLAWTTSVSRDGGPEFNNVFFTRLGTRSSGIGQRFGSNAIEVTLPGWPPRTVYDGSPADAIAFASNAGVYDPYSPDGPEGLDRDGVPVGRRLDHGGGSQSIGNYIVTASEFVSLPCIPFLDDACPDHGNRNIPPSGQASQVIAYDITSRTPKPSLLIARKNEGSGWVAIAKLGAANTPPVLRHGYLLMVPDGDRLGLYAIQADPCTGYASLAQVKPSFAIGHRTPPRIDPLAPPACPGVRSQKQQTQADVRQIAYIGCVKRTEQDDFPASDPGCPNMVSMYEDGQLKDFPAQADVQSAHFVTQANGELYLLAFEGQQVELGSPNSEIQLWRVVFGAASGIARALWRMPDGSECYSFLCVVRAGTEGARDSFKNMHVDRINGAMFRFGGGAYIVSHSNPALDTFFVYGTQDYLQRTPRVARFNEF